MSLILEALKKSEAERQLGRAPGLTTPVRMSRRRVSPHLWWALALLLVLLAAALIAWRGQAAPASPGQDDNSAVGMRQPASTDRSARAADTLPGVTAAEPAQANPHHSAIGTMQSSTADGPDSSRAETRETAEFVSIERESATVPASPPPPPNQAPAPSAVPAQQLEPTPPLSVRTPAQETVDPSKLGVSPLDLPRQRDLTPSERDALPPLKLSMHVFTDAVETRFVLIDGRRYQEGTKIAPSLIVEEIRRDGAVLNFNQKRFLLPRP